MSLLQEQMEFSLAVAWLINKASEMGYGVTLGDAYRDPRLFGKIGERKGYGSPRSFHKKRLAIDLNLFRGRSWLSDTKDHAALGKAWEEYHPKAVWGGRFNDGNHYSWGEK
jgi:hypothetical protein